MKKHQKKRIGTFIVGLVLSIMITPFCFYKLSEPVNALSNVITYNTYGSFTRSNEVHGFNGNGMVGYSLSSSAVIGELNGIYNGTVTINYSIGNGLSIANFSVIPENCHIIGYSSSYMQIEFYGVSNWSVTFLETTAKGISGDITNIFSDLTINSLSGWNMTYLERSDSAVMVNIQNRLSDLKTYTDGIEGLLTTNNQLLQTIANNGGSGGSSTVNNIDINVDHIADELSLLKTSNDSILDELLGFFTDGLGQMLTIESVIDAIETTTTALTGIQTQLTGIGTTLNSINTTLNNINTAVQNIDNSIDSISWINQSVTSTWCNTQFGTYHDYASSNAYNPMFIKITPVTTSDNNNTTNLYRFVTPVRIDSGSVRAAGFDIKIYDENGTEYPESLVYYCIYNLKLVVYFVPRYSSSNNTNTMVIKVTTNNNTNMRYSLDTPIFQYLPDSDIEYWDLVSYFDQYNMQRKILTALEQLSINVHGDIIQQTEQVINNYDTDFTTIHNIENTFTNNFDNTNPSVLSLLNQNLQLPNEFLEGSSFVKVLFPKVVDNSSLVGFPYFLILAIVVLIVLLG